MSQQVLLPLLQLLLLLLLLTLSVQMAMRHSCNVPAGADVSTAAAEAAQATGEARRTQRASRCCNH
jgi:hypothetical protein